MRRIATLMVLVVLCSSVAFAGGSQEDAAEQTYRWRIGFNTVEGSVRDVTAREFKRVVEERSNGRIQVEIFPAEQLGSEQEMIESVMIGALDIQLSGGPALQNLFPEVLPPSLPFMVSSYEEAHALLDGPYGDLIREKGREHNLEILSFLDLGFAQITTNRRPIRQPSDLEGLQVRSPNEPAFIETFRALGARVSTLPFTEVYLALSQGVVDAQFNPLDAIYDTKFYEVQDYLAITNHAYYYFVFMMNRGLWESLPADIQAIVQEGANAARDRSREWFETKDAEMLEALRPHFREITEPDTALFQEKLVPVYQNQFAQMVPPAALTMAQDFLTDYRASQ